jgi:uncharacterized protein (TIRG00374 family)
MNADLITPTPDPKPLTHAWWRVLLGLLIAGMAIWYFAQNVSAREVWTAAKSAEPLPILLTVLVIITTGLTKSLRWKWLFSPAKTQPSMRVSYAGVMLGQMVNLISPVPRLGDVMRLYHVHDAAATNIGQAFGTLVTEKSLDLLVMLITIVLVLPFLALEVVNPLPTLSGIVVAVLLMLYLLAYQTAWVLKMTARMVSWLPDAVASRLLTLVHATLRGVSALRHPRLIIQLLLISGIISMLHILPAYLLSQAFGFHLTFADAALINFAAFFGILIPAGAINIGVQELLISFVLTQLGMTNTAAALSYALVYRAVVIVPPLLIGGGVALTLRWKWRDAWHKVAARR